MRLFITEYSIEKQVFVIFTYFDSILSFLCSLKCEQSTVCYTQCDTLLFSVCPKTGSIGRTSVGSCWWPTSNFSSLPACVLSVLYSESSNFCQHQVSYCVCITKDLTAWGLIKMFY